MIKKIDANKYGVVRYAISSIEDIADLPREVSVGSEAILVNEDGEKKFRLGSDGWVEVVEVKEYDENKLRDMLEDAKVGYGGIEYETLEERLDKDFDNVYSVLDNRTYVEYEGCRITAKDSLNGLQKDTVIKGRTLQNLVDRYGNTSDQFLASCYHKKGMIKPSTTYTSVIYNYSSELLQIYINEVSFKYKLITVEPNRYRVDKFQSNSTLDTGSALFKNHIKHELDLNYKVLFLEGDYTETPLEELPFIEGIESVGDKSKNLVKGMVIDMNHAEGTYVMCEGNHAMRNSIIKLPKGKYSLSFEKFNSSELLDGGILIWDNTESTTWKRKNSNTSNFEILEDEVGITWYGSFSTKERKDEVVGSFIQIEEGETATPYQEYYDGYKISGKSIGKNLAKTLTEDNYEPKGTGKVIFENNKCIATDKTGWAGCFIIGKEAIKVKPNTIYYGMVECEEDAEYLSQTKLIYKCFDINNNVISTSGAVTLSNNAVNFYNTSYNDVYEAFLPIPDQYKYIKFSSEVHSVKLIFRPATSFGTITNTFKNIMFVETDKQPTYEPYKETTYSYILDEPLRSLPNGVCDEIDLEKGVVTRRVEEVVLDGSESDYTPYSTDGSQDTETTVIFRYGHYEDCPTWYDKKNAIVDTMPVVGDLLYGLPNCGYASDTTSLIFRIEKSKLETQDVDGFKKWLQENPTTVYYQLKNPTIEYLIKDDKFVTLPNGVKDEISHNSVLRKVGKIVLDGSKVYESVTGVEGIVRWAYNLPEAKMGGSCICSMFDYVAPVQTWKEPFKDGITVNSENGTILIYIDKYKEMGQHTKEVRALLDGLEVYYELETPYTEPINLDEVILDTTRLKSYEPITHITSDNYLPPTIKTQVPSDFNAVVLGLKSNNEELTSQVMSLRQTNDELETTNREQDDVIDVTLLALDEVYGMIDEGEIETMSVGSPMVNVYVKMIKRGIKTLDEVPAKYRAEVEELI